MWASFAVQKPARRASVGHSLVPACQVGCSKSIGQTRSAGANTLHATKTELSDARAGAEHWAAPQRSTRVRCRDRSGRWPGTRQSSLEGIVKVGLSPVFGLHETIDLAHNGL